ncbi:hypothetical protein, partial [Azoarcus sp. TTM-91]|uniref:hypothetical protein n=1 Tax=Azoarcus sp. TTM-91 TaxID=2691581 RepID=UPI001B7CFE0B
MSQDTPERKEKAAPSEQAVFFSPIPSRDEGGKMKHGFARWNTLWHAGAQSGAWGRGRTAHGTETQ